MNELKKGNINKLGMIGKYGIDNRNANKFQYGNIYGDQ